MASDSSPLVRGWTPEGFIFLHFRAAHVQTEQAALASEKALSQKNRETPLCTLEIRCWRHAQSCPLSCTEIRSAEGMNAAWGSESVRHSLPLVVLGSARGPK